MTRSFSVLFAWDFKFRPEMCESLFKDWNKEIPKFFIASIPFCPSLQLHVVFSIVWYKSLKERPIPTTRRSREETSINSIWARALTTKRQQLKMIGRQKTVDMNIPWLSKYCSSAKDLNNRCIRTDDLFFAFDDLTAIFSLQFHWYIPLHRHRRLKRIFIVFIRSFQWWRNLRRAKKIRIWIFERPRVKMMIKRQMAWNPPKAINHGSNQLILKKERWTSSNNAADRSYRSKKLPIVFDLFRFNEWVTHEEIRLEQGKEREMKINEWRRRMNFFLLVVLFVTDRRTKTITPKAQH